MQDERKSGYPHQNDVDPLAGRLAMYLNAKDCALEWIDYAVDQAKSHGKSAVFFMLHASFYAGNGRRWVGNYGIGDYYKDRLFNITKAQTPKAAVRVPYRPLFEKLTQVALANKDLMFYVVHSDAHYFQTLRMNPHKHNGRNRVHSNHNLMIHMVEGSSRALTMYSRFTVDKEKFQPVTLS